MKKNTFILIIFLGLFSCNDFLEVEPSIPTPKEAFSSPESAPQLVNAVYSKLLDWNISSFSWIGISEITSDNADKGSDAGDTGADKHLLDSFDFSTDCFSCNEIWEGNYQGIARANQALNYLPDLAIEETLKNRLIGEVKFLRALFYFRLVRAFGGVPLIKSLPEIQNQEDIDNGNTRATRENVYAFIVEDLEDAVEKTILKSEYSDNDLGRVSKGAAISLLAKVFLYQEEWQKAFDMTSQVMNMGYSLTSDYSKIWREIGENNEESIFEIQARGELPNKGVDKYSVVQGARGEGGFGWGFNSPSQNLHEAYEAGDSRRDATIIYKGEILFDGFEVSTAASNERYNQKAYVSKILETANQDDKRGNKNIRILRYAEVLLINAEAANELGLDALSPLNQVRARAFGDQNHSIIETDQASLRSLIWKERRLELAMEHDRFFDLVRQKRAGRVLRAHGKNFVDGKNELFPIPQSQIDISNGKLEQNPGY